MDLQYCYYVSFTFYVLHLLLYFVLTEAWYESTGIREPIDELYIYVSSFKILIGY